MIDPIWPSPKLVTITPSDTTVFSPAIRQIYVGTGGNVVVVDAEGNTVTFSSVPSGFYITPVFVSKVKATGTTTSGLVGFY